MKTTKNGNPKHNKFISWGIKTLALALVILLMPFCPVYKTVADINKYGRSADGLWTYKLIDKANRTVAIRPNKLGELSGNVTIPSKISIQDQDYTVVRVGRDAFCQCLCNNCLRKNKKGLEVAWENTSGNYTGEELDPHIGTITIPSTVNTIETSAFEDYIFSRVRFESPSSLKVIEENAFCGASFDSITVPATVATIGESCFDNCDVKTVSFASGSNIKSFGDEAFCEAEIGSITLPSSLTSISAGCFFRSTIKSIDIPSNVSEIKKYAFAGCEDLKEVNIPKNGDLSKIGYAGFMGIGISSLTIPSGLKNVGDYTWSNCEKLHTVNMEYNNEPSSFSKLAFVKVQGFDPASDDIESVDEYKYKTNTAVDKVNLHNYDVYKWMCGKGLFDGKTTVHSDKTRVFIQKKSDSKGDINGTTSIAIDNYFKVDKGYHYENKIVEYGNKADESATTKVNAEGNSVSNNNYPFVVLHADLKGNSYQLKFDANAKNVENMPSSNLNCTYGETVHFPKAEPKKKGHIFRGWSKYKNGKGTFYKAGQRVKENFSSTEHDVVNMYAAWEAQKVHIKAELNGGTSNQKEVTANYGSKLSDVLYAPTKDGYDFVGWSMSDKGKALGKDYTIDKETDFTVYAVWKKNTKKVTISFSQPKNTDRDSFYEITVTRDGTMIQSHNVMASDMGIENIVLTGAKVGERYVITCTNYVKEKGRKKYFTPVTKEVVITK